MPVPPTQPDPKEAVEGQLCAYLEGELSEAERASIDEHLAVHPQHRQLLADLAGNRDLLRGLPREPAPPEVGEAFRQQVERSLLMGEDQPPSARWSGLQWRQLGTVAALLLMTAALAVVIAPMLYGPNRPAVRFAVTVPPAPATSAQSTSTPATSATSQQELPAAAPLVIAKAAPATPPAPTTATSDAGGLATRAMTDAAARVTNRPAPADTMGPLAMARPSAAAPSSTAAAAPVSRTVHLQVTTADPAAVDRFLTRSGLALADGPAPGDGATAAAGGGRATRATFHDEVAAASQQQAANDAAPSNGFVANNAAALPPQQYVVRGLTPAQVRQFTADLTAAAPGGRVTITSVATRPTAAEIVRGQLVTVVIPQLTGAGVDRTNVVRVADDGTIALPMLDAVPAAGATPDDLARRVADRYRQANLIANPAVTVTAAGPTTRTAAGDTVYVDVLPSSPATAR